MRPSRGVTGERVEGRGGGTYAPIIVPTPSIIFVGLQNVGAYLTVKFHSGFALIKMSQFHIPLCNYVISSLPLK